MGNLKTRKNRRRKPLAPPLSFLDRSIYHMGIILSFVLCLGGGVLYVVLVNQKHKSEPSVIASVLSGGMFCIVPFLLYTMLSGVIFFQSCLLDRKPLFGRKDISYGPPKWAAVYPVFAKKYRNVWVRPSHPSVQSLKRTGIKLWIIGFFITLILLPLSFYGRRTITEDDHLHHYNCFNVERAYAPEDFESLRIYPAKVGRWYRNSITLTMTFIMKDGTHLKFSVGSFTGESRQDNLEYMLRLKSYFSPEEIIYANPHLMERLLHQYRSDPYCIDLINRIFDLQEGSEAAP